MALEDPSSEVRGTTHEALVGVRVGARAAFWFRALTLAVMPALTPANSAHHTSTLAVILAAIVTLTLNPDHSGRYFGKPLTITTPCRKSYLTLILIAQDGSPFDLNERHNAIGLCC